MSEGIQDIIKEWLPDKCFVLKYKASRFACIIIFGNWFLIYIRDGFSSDVFHKQCDGVGPTLTFILSSSFHIFGGYAGDSWSSPTTPAPFPFYNYFASTPYTLAHRHAYEYKSNPSTFIFTISNPFSIPPTRYLLKEGNKYGMLCQGCYGPLFGGGGYGCDVSS